MSDAQRIVLALDAHGGDFGPAVTIAAAEDALRRDERLVIRVVGQSSAIRPRVKAADRAVRDRLEHLPAESVIAADARPVSILRKGRGSSLWTALEQVADGQAHACISAGNTVAIVTLGLKLLGTLPGIRRPALMSQIPSARGMVSMLDLGANLNVDARQLLEFAVMGAIVRSEAGSDEKPSIGLLNVGHEDSKGHNVVREAHETLQAVDLDYRGFIEGHDIFAGKVDVAVCDGFSGNLILKSSEGLAAMLFGELRRTLASTRRARVGAWLARPALKRMLERLDPAKHNGAPLLGLNGVVVKSHGRAGRFALTQAILEAGQEVNRHVPKRIAAKMKDYENEGEQ